MDAAIAAAATLAIAIPFMNGLGGDAIALHGKADGEVTAINGSGATPRAMSVGALRSRGLTAMPQRGPVPVTVPGVVAAWGEALDRFAGFDPDIVLLDIGLPGLDGYEVARLMRDRATRPIRLVVLTGWGQESDRRRAREAGFDAHLVKPVDPETLQRTIGGAR